MAVVALAAHAASPATGADRTWTNVEGVTVVGEIIRVQDGDVSLRVLDRDGARQRPSPRRAIAGAADPPPPPRRVVRIPLRRLSLADREWIDRHDKLRGARRWGQPPAEGQRDTRPRGRVVRVQKGNVVIERGGSQALVSLTDLSYEDFVHLEAWHDHYGESLSSDALAYKPPKPKRERAAPRHLTGVGSASREWTDTRGRSVTARFAGTENGRVVLSMGGEEYRTPLARLSEDDQRWVAGQALAKLGEDVSGSVGWLFDAAGGMPPVGGPAFAGNPASQGGGGLAFSSREESPFPQRPDARSPSIRSRAEALGAPRVETPPQPSRESAPRREPAVVPQKTAPVSAKPVEPAPTDPPAAAESTAFQPIDDIGDLSPNQIDARLEEVFGEEDLIGFAECEHCYAEFGYPASFSEGDPCPFCTRPVTELVSMEELEEALTEAFEVDERPWYATRGGRRLIFWLLIAVAGMAAKAFAGAVTGTGGGGGENG